MSLASFIKKRYGVNTHSRTNRMGGVCGLAAAQLCPNDPNRLALLIVNLSVNIVYLSFDNLVGPAHGIYLGANGGYLALNWQDDLETLSREVWGIATGAGSAVYVLETLESNPTD